MLEPVRSFERSSVRRIAMGGLATCVMVGSLLVVAEPASADEATDYTSLQTAFSGGAAIVNLDNSVDASGQKLTLVNGANTVLDLHGYTLQLDTLQLSTVSPTLGAQGSTLTVANGTLVVAHASDSTSAAIEVDALSSITFDDAAVTATVPSNGSGAAIGGGSVGGSTESAGSITIQNGSTVSASGSASGAAIGGGNRGGGGSIAISDSNVSATSTGSAAAIGGGANPANGAVGSVTITNHSVVAATASGSGSAVGGGVAGGAGSVRITDFATLTADARSGQVAIGDGPGADQGMTFDAYLSSSVTAMGGNGAGIGSASGAVGSDVINTHDRSRVVASAANGPGIGGTGNTGLATVSIADDSTVTATGGNGGAAVGGGSASSYGATTTVDSGATLTVAAGPATSAIGAVSGGRFGSLTNNGHLVLPAGQRINIPVTPQSAPVPFINNGDFTNSGSVTVSGEFDNGGSITNTGLFDGSGFISNSGTILQNGTLNTLVEGSYFDVKYDSQGGSVAPNEQIIAADSFRAAGVVMPTAVPPSIGSFSGWNTSPDGTGATVNDRTSISGAGIGAASTTGRPTEIRLYALYQLQPVLRTDSALPQAVVGSAYSASVAATSGTNPIVYSYTGDLPAGLSLDPSSGLVTGVPTTSGTFNMHLLARNAAGPTSHDYTIQVVATVLHVSAPSVPKAGARYLAGGRFDVTLSGLQANESYKVTIGGSTVASGRAPTNQAFSVRTTIPKAIGDGSQAVRLSGADHALGASTSILTAAVSKSLGLKLSAKKVKHGKKIVITVSKLYAGESARIVISGKHGKVNVGKGTSKGGYVLTLKSGLAKGKYTVTVTGAGTSRKASAKLTVS